MAHVRVFFACAAATRRSDASAFPSPYVAYSVSIERVTATCYRAVRRYREIFPAIYFRRSTAFGCRYTAVSFLITSATDPSPGIPRISIPWRRLCADRIFIPHSADLY